MKVLLAGTFDPIHPGHIRLFRRAKKVFSGELYVIVSRDENVIRFKGRPPAIPDTVRAFIVANIKPVDYVFLGSKDIIKRIRLIKPDVIVLGYDQRPSESWLRKELNKYGLNPKIVRGPKFETFVGSSTELKKKIYEWVVKYCKRFFRQRVGESLTENAGPKE